MLAIESRIASSSGFVRAEKLGFLVLPRGNHTMRRVVSCPGIRAFSQVEEQQVFGGTLSLCSPRAVSLVAGGTNTPCHRVCRENCRE